jgi:P-type Ca2+ transporter type 2C
LSPQLHDLLNSTITVNSTAFKDADPNSREVVFVGSKTETALLKFAKELGWNDYKETWDAVDVVQMIPFSSKWKVMGIVIRIPCGRFRLHLKGTSKILTKKCTHHIMVCKNTNHWGEVIDPVETAEINEMASNNISQMIVFYVNQAL